MDENQEIVEVWSNNLVEEMTKISKLIESYTYVAIDTEFPGFLLKTSTSFQTTDEERYRTQTANVNLTKIIQFGITIGDSKGNLAYPICTWQFNFHFRLEEDLYNQDAIRLLRMAGIDFKQFELNGIDPVDFSYLLFSSGLVMNDKIFWICFHGGYDFAYLIKMLTGSPLPPKDIDFTKSLQLYFPNFFDLKEMSQKPIGLQELAEEYGVTRVGSQHQAGSDSFVTLKTFYEFMNKNYSGISPKKIPFKNKLFGICGSN